VSGVRPVLAAAIACGIVAVPLAATPVTVTVVSRSIQPGELVVLTLSTRTAVDDVYVRAFGRDLKPMRVNPTEWRALVGIDLDTKPGRHDVSIVTGASTAERTTHTLTVRPKTFRTRTLSVDAAFVNPPAETVARIADEAARLNAIWAASSAVPLWSGPFVRPVPDPANSAFGTRSVFNGERRSPHGGADFSSVAGTPVKSPNSGRVVLAGDLYFTGNTVVIDHGAGLFSLFAHLRSMTVRESDWAMTGMVIGEVGATGRATGPHLHWTVRVNDARVDPLSLLAVLGN
jgi:murein DD-endopeptidase MepM/ murein hydrolase activator NlpD